MIFIIGNVVDFYPVKCRAVNYVELWLQLFVCFWEFFRFSLVIQCNGQDNKISTVHCCSNSLWYSLPKQKVSSCLGSFYLLFGKILPVWIIINKTYRMGMLVRWWWISSLGLTSNESVFLTSHSGSPCA